MYATEVTAAPPCGLINIRAGEGVRGMLDEALGLRLPRSPNATAAGGAVAALWLGPDEWLARTADGAEFALAARLRSRARGGHIAVTVVTDGYAVLRISGRQSRDVLSQGVGIDLHPVEFPPGRCARAAFGKTSAILHHLGEGRYDLYAWRSYRRYVESYLRKCAGRAV